MSPCANLRWSSCNEDVNPGWNTRCRGWDNIHSVLLFWWRRTTFIQSLNNKPLSKEDYVSHFCDGFFHYLPSMQFGFVVFLSLLPEHFQRLKRHFYACISGNPLLCIPPRLFLNNFPFSFSLVTLLARRLSLHACPAYCVLSNCTWFKIYFIHLFCTTAYINKKLLCTIRFSPLSLTIFIWI